MKKRRQGCCCTQLVRWTKADDGAILAADGALTGARAVWQPADCLNRGTVLAQDAKWRFSRNGKRARERVDEPPSGLSAFVSAGTPPKKACVGR